jgi:Tfp pilus assembly protein PilV
MEPMGNSVPVRGATKERRVLLILIIIIAVAVLGFVAYKHFAKKAPGSEYTVEEVHQLLLAQTEAESKISAAKLTPEQKAALLKTTEAESKISAAKLTPEQKAALLKTTEAESNAMGATASLAARAYAADIAASLKK